MPLPITKGPAIGTCNVCGQKNQKLTSDHVPPKGTIKYPRMKLHSLVDFMGAQKFNKVEGRSFQQGVKFRTICESCNSRVIGTLYDPPLVALSNDISKYMFSQVVRPKLAYFRTQPDLVARAIAGHILALGLEHYPRGEMGDALASFVLDRDAAPPDGLGIYYWVYPYWEQVSIRCFSFLINFGTPPLIVSLLKYTPIAFMLTWKADPIFNIPYPNLLNYFPNEPGGFADVPLDFTLIPPARYPEMPGKEGVSLHGQDSYLATHAK